LIFIFKIVFRRYVTSSCRFEWCTQL